VAERGSVAAGLDAIVDDLAKDIGSNQNAGVHYTLKFEADRLDLILTRYRERKGTGLREALLAANAKGEHRDKEFVRALAVLHGGADGEYEPWAQMGLALIPLGTRDSDLIRLLEERKHAQRLTLKMHYDQAFRGVGKTTSDTLEEHIISDTSGHTRQKALALVDHELTAADHLALVTTAIDGSHDETALDILQRTWHEGVNSFDKLEDDWQRFVRGPGFTTYSLDQAMEKELGGVHLDAAREIFLEYHKMRNQLGLNATDSMDAHEGTAERSATRLEASTIEIALASGVFSAKGDLAASAAGHLRKAWEKRIKRDPQEAAAWKAQQEAFDKRFRDGWTLRGEDMVEARIQLRRDPTFVDKIYLAAKRGQYGKVVDAATDAWQAGVEAELEHDLRNPPADDPRPAFTNADRATLFNDDDHTPAYDALTNPQLTHAERGAVRLQLALNTSGTTKAGDLENAYRFLKSIKKPAVRTQVIASYVERYLDTGGAARDKGTLVETGTKVADPTVRFCEALQTSATGFEQSPTMIDLLHLLMPGTGLSDALGLAERRDRSTHTGVLDFASTGLVSLYDTVSAEDTQEVADDALSRLRQWVRRTGADPAEMQAVMDAEGVAEVTALAQLGYERFAERLDEVRSVKASVSESIGMFVDFAGRSLLVAVLGPAGLPGLVAALGAYTAGMLLREGLLGVEYQLVSKENLSTLVAEVATFGFDEMQIESVIKELVPRGAAPGRIFGSQGMTEAQAKFAQDYMKTSGSKLFEKAAQNMVEGKNLPTDAELLARAAHALAAAGLKGLSDKILTSPTVFTPTAKRFRENIKKIILNGPPPKAALGYAMGKELTDMLAAPDWGNTTFEQKLARVVKTGLISIASAVPVSAAFTSLGAREASRAKKLAASHPDVFYARMHDDPVLAQAYDQYKASVKGLPGVRERSFAQWMSGHQGAELGTGKVAHLAGAGTPNAQHQEVDVQKAASGVMKEMDQVMSPR
jgi:hypothetical protein